MVSYEDIIFQIERGYAYYTQQINATRLKMVDGCFTCTPSDLNCLAATLLSLEYDVATENNTDLTTRTYNLLLKILTSFTGTFTADPTVQIPGITILAQGGDYLQTSVVYPDEGETTYTFSELIGTEPLTVYRSTGTVLRAHAGAPDNEFAQVDTETGEVTLSSPFNPGESLWVAYKTII